jgi:fatty acid desaturase
MSKLTCGSEKRSASRAIEDQIMDPATSGIYFCDPAPSFAQLKVADVSAAKRRALRGLYEQDDRHALMPAFFAVLWAVGAWISVSSYSTFLQVVGCACSVAALIGLSVSLHEASHKLLLRNTALNELIGFLCGMPVLIPVSAFRTNHRFHHLRRGDHGEPADETLDFALLRTLPAYCLGLGVKSFGFATVLPVIAIVKADGRTRFRTLGEYALLIGIVWWAVVRYPLPILWRIWLMPLLLTALLSQLRAVAEHGLTAKGSVFTASRTVVSNRVVRFLMCNINYHLEHHLFPSVPWYNLPRAHALLREEYRRTGASIYGSYRHFYLDFLRATWRGIRAHARLIPTENGRPADWRGEEA